MDSNQDQQKVAGKTPDETVFVDKVSILAVESSAAIIELDPVKVEKTTMSTPKPNVTKEEKKGDAPVYGASSKPEETKSKEEPVPAKSTEEPHYGEHSVAPTDVIHVNINQAGARIGQNIIQYVSAAVKTLKRRFNWEFEHNRMSFTEPLLWSRPFGLSTTWEASTELYWLVNGVGNAISTSIEPVPAVVKGSFRLADQPGILNSGASDLHTVIKTIRGTSRMSKPVADRLCSRINVNLEVTDLSGFFVSGFFLAAHLQYMESAGIVPVWAALPANCVITANIAAFEDHAANAAIASLELALNEQALAFEYRRLTKRDIDVILSIAIGGANSVGAAGGAGILPITTFVTWPHRKFLFWSEHDIVLPAQRAVFTAADVRTSLAAIAKLLDCYDDYANGFVRAASILVMRGVTWVSLNQPAAVAEPVAGPSREDREVAETEAIYNNVLDRVSAKRDEYSAHCEQIGRPVPGRYRQPSGSSVEMVLSGEPESRSQSWEVDGEPDEIGDALAEELEALFHELDIAVKAALQAKQMAALKEAAKKAKKSAKPPTVYSRGVIHAMQECGTIQIQYVRGHNFLFDIMRIKKPERVNDRHLWEDGLFLSGMNSEEQMRTCLVIGGLLSVSASTVLNSINITGRELTLWATSAGCKSTDLLKPIFAATQSGRTAPYFQLVVGAFQQLVEGNLSPNFVRGASVFSGGGVNMLEIASERSWWRNRYNTTVPYLVEPASLSWAYRGFADVWGYSGPNPKVDFSHDVVTGGANDEEYISFHRDEPKYMEQAGSLQPFIYIPYGIISINLLKQHVDAVGPWILYMRLVKTCARGTGDLELPDPNIWQPRYIAGLGVIEAGTLLTYDWARDSQIVPGLTRVAVGDAAFFEIIRLGTQILPGVGLIRDIRKMLVPTPSSFLGLLPGIQGLDMGDDFEVAGSSSGN